MAKNLSGSRFVIVVLGVLIIGSVVSARAGMPIQDDAAAQLNPDSADKVVKTAADRLGSSRAGNAALQINAPSCISQPLSVTPTTAEPTLRDMVDLDGDGDIDFLGNTGAGDDLFWWENDGDLGFTEHIISADHNSSFVEGFDIDGDSDMDIVTYVPPICDVVCINDGELFWWKNDGSQSFTQSSIREVTLRSTTHSPHIVDLDKDGDGDLVIYSSSSALFWLEFTGSGWYYHLISGSTQRSFEGLEDIISGDFDGDGDLDIVTPNDYSHPNFGTTYDALWFWENDGTMSFPTHIRIDETDEYHSNRDVKTVDFDDDGDLDLLSSNGDVEWWENQGDLQFVRQDIIGNSTSNLYAGDLEGDGDVDIFYIQGPWMLMENLGAGDYQRRSLALTDPEKSLFGDLDNDGISDLLAYSNGVDEYFNWVEYAQVNPAALPFYEGFEGLYLGTSWENQLSEDGEVSIQSETLISGTQSLHFDYPTAEIILYLDLAGKDQVDLSYLLANEFEPYAGDGLYISADGIDWHLVASRTITTTMDILQYEIDLDEAARANGLTLNDEFQVKFSLNVGGYWLDEVDVTSPDDRFSSIFLPMIARLEE